MGALKKAVLLKGYTSIERLVLNRSGLTLLSALGGKENRVDVGENSTGRDGHVIKKLVEPL